MNPSASRLRALCAIGLLVAAAHAALGALRPQRARPLGAAEACAPVGVAGDVEVPGVVCLRGEARVLDAVSAAGGASRCVRLPDAVIEAGEALVLHGCELERSWLPGALLLAAGLPLDPNLATAADFEALPDVGPATAAALVATRAEAPYASLEDLDRVPGIGPKTLEKLRPYLRVRRPAGTASGRAP